MARNKRFSFVDRVGATCYYLLNSGKSGVTVSEISELMGVSKTSARKYLETVCKWDFAYQQSNHWRPNTDIKRYFIMNETRLITNGYLGQYEDSYMRIVKWHESK
jgi:hypothetical protein